MISLDKVSKFCYDITELIFPDNGISLKSNQNDSIIGFFGQLDPKVASKFDIDIPVWYLELDGDFILNMKKDEVKYVPLLRYPAAHRDLAFIISDNIKAADVEAVINQSGGSFLERVELFDLFSGKGIPDGCKSLAFHLIFRSIERTLGDKEVDGFVEKIISTASDRLGAVLRSN